ncbi:hypothetical protein [Tunturiibacter lichenicola]|jgi:hypothetical protein|uniref:hypothetical protein n=1 Tax=Tunturiibacter lichenicola TaxID=2051959 RepID=UPI003D9B398B
MPLEAFSGIWNFDRDLSQLKSPPSQWKQTIQIEGDRVRVEEQITRENGRSAVEVYAAFNEEFYEVKGSPLVDEMSYFFDGESIHGTGRKQGVVILREIVSLPTSDILRLLMRLFLNGKEIPLGEALFRRDSFRTER